MHIRLLLLSVAIALPVAAGEIVHATALPPVVMRELATMPLLREGEPRVYEHRLLPPLRFGLHGERPASAEVPAPTIAPPRVTQIFDADNSRRYVPADSAGAVGPAHIVTSTNARILVFDRNGKALTDVIQDHFWASGLPAGEYYDPRAAYDPVHDRWILMTVYDESGVAFAVSATGDPAGTWRRYKIDEPGADYSMIGVTRDHVIFGTNGYDTAHSVHFSVRKQDLYSGTAVIPVQAHRVADAFAHPVSTSGGNQYVVEAGYGFVHIRDLTRSSWSLSTAEPATWGAVPFRLLPQLGGMDLDGGYGYLDDVKERDGWIYLVMTRFAGSAGETVAWARINLETKEAQWGAVARGDADTTYAYPSLAVNRHGGMLIAFSVFHSKKYVSSAYVYRDAFGRVSSVAPIREGTSAVTVHERWGDYTTTLVDPVDDTAFWTAQIHAHNGSWKTTWAKIETVVGKRRAARH